MSDLTYIPATNPLESIDWQRSNAEILKAWLTKECEWYEKNHNDFWARFHPDIFDLRTCDDFGLSVWAIILNEPTYGVTKSSGEDYEDWGFGEYRFNFNLGNFGTNDDSGYNFTTEQVRTMLLLKAFILHMSGAIHGEGVIGINEALNRIFGAGSVYCIDNRDMSLGYVLYDDSIVGLALELYQRDLLPRPVGMGISLVLNGNTETFGFGENNFNFNNGNFASGEVIGD